MWDFIVNEDVEQCGKPGPNGGGFSAFSSCSCISFRQSSTSKPWWLTVNLHLAAYLNWLERKYNSRTKRGSRWTWVSILFSEVWFMFSWPAQSFSFHTQHNSVIQIPSLCVCVFASVPLSLKHEKNRKQGFFSISLFAFLHRKVHPVFSLLIFNNNNALSQSSFMRGRFPISQRLIVFPIPTLPRFI